jgi:hypothetical protein
LRDALLGQIASSLAALHELDDSRGVVLGDYLAANGSTASSEPDTSSTAGFALPPVEQQQLARLHAHLLGGGSLASPFAKDWKGDSLLLSARGFLREV